MSDDWAEFLHALIEAQARFLVVGAPLDALRISAADLERENQVIQIGLPPNRIDVLTSISGLHGFQAAWERRTEQPVRGRPVPFLGRVDLVATKRATGRQKDLGDLEALGEP